MQRVLKRTRVCDKLLLRRVDSLFLSLSYLFILVTLVKALAATYVLSIGKLKPGRVESRQWIQLNSLDDSLCWIMLKNIEFKH